MPLPRPRQRTGQPGRGAAGARARARAVGSALAAAALSLAPTGEAGLAIAAAAPREANGVRPDTADAQVRACSTVEPVCVHATPSHSGAQVLAVLDAAERAHHLLSTALRLPRPPGDGGRGGGPQHDIYLVPGDAPDRTVAEPLPGAVHDRAAAFSLLGGGGEATGCALQARAGRAVAEAIVVGVDAAAGEAITAMIASYLAALATPCDGALLAAVDAAQAAPESGIFLPRAGALAGSLLLPWYLETRLGSGRPGELAISLLAVSGQRAPEGAGALVDEPDLFDALRVASKDRGGTLGALLLDFAVARALLGSRGDGAELGGSRWLGDAGRVRFDWSIPFASLPRRLGQARPISPTGSSYLWLDLEKAPPHAGVVLVAETELPGSFRWAAVKIATDGSVAGRMNLPARLGATRVEQTVLGLDGLGGLLVVGVNVGDLDAAHPFDPDDGPFEPHGYEVTLYPQ